MKYTGDIRPICSALEQEAYLCRFQGFPPSDPSQVESPPSSNDAANLINVEEDEAESVDPRRPGQFVSRRRGTNVKNGGQREEERQNAIRRNRAGTADGRRESQDR